MQKQLSDTMKFEELKKRSADDLKKEMDTTLLS